MKIFQHYESLDQWEHSIVWARPMRAQPGYIWPGVAGHLALRHLLAPLPVAEVCLVSLPSEQTCLQLIILDLSWTNTQAKLLLQADNTLRLSEWKISVKIHLSWLLSVLYHPPPTPGVRSEHEIKNQRSIILRWNAQWMETIFFISAFLWARKLSVSASPWPQ